MAVAGVGSSAAGQLRGDGGWVAVAAAAAAVVAAVMGGL